MIFIFFLQLMLPLFFILWIGIAPTKSALAFCVQLLSTGLALFALHLTGLWLFPPWWTPWLFYGLLLAAAVIGWRRHPPFTSRWPQGWRAWLLTAGFFTLGGWGITESAIALTGRASQAGAVVNLVFPLKDGTYFVVSGGSTLNINPHLMTLDARMERFRAYRGQSYGIDIVKLDDWGLRATGLQPQDPQAYNIYGVAVYAPCAGVVMRALDGLPDMQVPQTDRDHMAGNHVLLRCADADVLLGHLKPGSLKVAEGARVAAGEPLGQVGNSGNTGEPHLHIHAQQPGTLTAPLSGNPLPVRFDNRFLVRNDRIIVP